MRTFTKLYSDFWINYDNSEVIRLGVEAQLMALYLQGNSHHNMLGVYYLPLLYIASDLRLPVKKVQTALRKLRSINYCQYDKRTQYVWVCNLALEQLGKDIDIKDNRIKAIHAIWKDLPSQLEFLEEIYQKYKSIFHLESRYSNTCKAISSLTSCISKNIEEPTVEGTEEDIKVIKDVKHIIDSSELNTELAVTDDSSNISVDTNIDTNNISTSVVTSRVDYTTVNFAISNAGKAKGETESKNINLNIELPTSLPIHIPPLEGSSEVLSRVLETETILPVIEGKLLKPPSEVSDLSLKGTVKGNFATTAPLQVTVFGKNSSDGFSSKVKDMVLQPPSKGLTSPFIVPSKGLRSPFGAPSKALRSNIDYRIENIEDRNKNKEKEIEERRKETTKKRDINLNRVPIPNIVAQARPCSELTPKDFYFSEERLGVFENTSLCLTTMIEPQPVLELEPKLGLETQSKPQLESDLELEIQSKSQAEVGLVISSTLLASQLALESELKPEPQPSPISESKSCLESQPQSPRLGLVSESPLELTSVLQLEPTLALKPELRPKLKPKRSVIIKPKKPTPKNDIDDSIAIVFSYWKTTMHHPRANLDHKRRALISEALKWGYTVQELCEAITGCSKTPHNTGKNEQGQRYDGLHVILRNADQIDRFIHNCHHPPEPYTEAHRRLHSNAHEANRWIRAKINESAGVRRSNYA